jgi:UTP--glucose-1-phosphate uridylyltransferase
MLPLEERLGIVAAAMASAAAPQLVVELFLDEYRQLEHWSGGSLTRENIGPVGSLPGAEDLSSFEAVGRKTFPSVIVMKLNGGLGTSMGLDAAKSLLPVKNGLRFIDIIARQIRVLHGLTGARIPLLLMDSTGTREDTRGALGLYPDLDIRSFLQHRVPKILVDGLLPVEWPADPALMWCPPGHGDLYAALQTTHLLETLRKEGYRYLFVSNADNLSATLDPCILGYIATHGIPFLMEVADRSASDRKGGHLARSRDGRLVLREFAQCPPEETTEFQDIERFQFFNTNNLWVDLDALALLLHRFNGKLSLPLIRNVKTVDPRDPASPRVYQLETAMGSAIALFDGARALRVPRSRFAPVKTTDDLLALWSDAYVLSTDFHIHVHPDLGQRPPVITLDRRYYGMLGDLERHFPEGAPSLLHCRSLTVSGCATFGRGVECRGDVRIVVPEGERLLIPDGTVLYGDRA